MRIAVGVSAVRDFTAAELGAAVAQGWRAAAPDQVELFALSDGVTGLAESLAAAPVAVVETSHLLTSPTTAPVAEALVAAVDAGADRVVLGMGRSRVHDGGRGFADVIRARYGSLSAAREWWTGTEITVVGNEPLPLLGLRGAGARLAEYLGPEEAQRRDRTVGDFAAHVEGELWPTATRPPRFALRPFSGLGGGSAFLALALGARAMSGLEYTADASGLTQAVATADLCLLVVDLMDIPALSESAAAAVAPAALASGCPVVVITREDHTSRYQRAALGVVGCYTTDALDPEALAVRILRVARTWAR